MEFEQYEHHGKLVWVRKDLKGTHRDHCLCFTACKRFNPGTDDNCEIAEQLLSLCQEWNLVTPVFECPYFC